LKRKLNYIYRHLNICSRAPFNDKLKRKLNDIYWHLNICSRTPFNDKLKENYIIFTDI
jgi:hypothetical protein